MTPSQSKKMSAALRALQDLRRVLDKEAANGMTGVGAPFGTNIDIDEAIFGVVYAEKAIARIFDREAFVKAMPESTRKKIRL